MSRNTLYFGIPLISRGAAKDWNVTTQLFNNTLASIYNQSNDQFRVLVACHDIPRIEPQYAAKTEFLRVQRPIPKTSDEKMHDKAAKKIVLGHRLRSLGGGYLMFLDADDLVHRNLVNYALTQQHPHGYVLKRGYELNVRQKKVRPLRELDKYCGSCAIIYFQPEDLPLDPQDRYSGRYFLKFKAHRTWEQVAAEHNRPLAKVPFEATVYVRNTGQNHSSTVPNLRHRLRLKQQLLALLENRAVSREIQDNFCIRLPA